jgi:hypothetical protein
MGDMILASISVKPTCFITLTMPLHKHIMPASDIISLTALSAPCATDSPTCSICPVKIAIITDNRDIIPNILASIFLSPFADGRLPFYR